MVVEENHDRHRGCPRDLPVVERVTVGDHTLDPRFEGRRAKGEIAPHGEADECDVFQAEMVEHRPHRSLPAEIEREPRLSTGRSLTRPVEADHTKARGREVPHHRVELLDERVVAPVEDDRALAFCCRFDRYRGEKRRTVGDPDPLDPVIRESAVEELGEPVVERVLVRILGERVELGGAVIERRVH